MAIDTKLTSSILDLSRNVDKLTIELRKNQAVKNQETTQTLLNLNQTLISLGSFRFGYAGMFTSRQLHLALKGIHPMLTR
jgi:hypothetical protein